MSLSSLVNRRAYIGDGSSATFSFPYYFFTQSDLSVYLFNTTTGVVSPQTLNTNYTISGTVNQYGLYSNGANVVMASAVLSSVYIVITRDPDQTQNFILQQNAVIPSSSLTQQLDYLTLLLQRQQDINSSCVRLNDGFGGIFDPILPSTIAQNSNCFIAINGSGNGFVLVPGGTNTVTDLSGTITGVLPLGNGGLGSNSGFTQHSLLYMLTASAAASIPNGTSGQILIAQSGASPVWQTTVLSAPGYLSPNLLVNSAFDHWQALPSGSNVVNAVATYFADQWYVANSLGTNSVLNVSKTAGVIPRSISGMQLQITTAPTAAQSNGFEAWQVLENPVTISNFVGMSSAVATVNIKALGQINQIGVQLFSCSGEVKAVGAALGSLNAQSSITSEFTFIVNSNAFVYASTIFSPSYGAGVNGVVAVRFRAIAAQSGNVYALNNGFVLEQAGLYSASGNNVGPISWSRKFFSPESELAACIRFYEKSYNPTVALATSTPSGVLAVSSPGNITNGSGWWNTLKAEFRNVKRATPVIQIWDLQGNVGKVSYMRNDGPTLHNATVTAGSTHYGFSGWSLDIINIASTAVSMTHWEADSRI